jgi:hypothetical protein
MCQICRITRSLKRSDKQSKVRSLKGILGNSGVDVFLVDYFSIESGNNVPSKLFVLPPISIQYIIRDQLGFSYESPTEQ